MLIQNLEKQYSIAHIAEATAVSTDLILWAEDVSFLELKKLYTLNMK